jgi:16S rRNA (adenine1518-N6/adenine1519-N6)-dimethyltransferase
VIGLVADQAAERRDQAAGSVERRVGSPEQFAGSGDQAAQPSLRRMRQFEVRPNRDLGQNFLVDSNILGVIDKAAALGSEDVVLEIGGGLGVLSEYLAPRVSFVHVVEIDERLRDALGDAVDPFENVLVHWADAMTLDLGALQPAPTKVVANLPYGIAAGALLRTIEELASVSTWLAMVQREVGERLAAAPGNGTYGATSVMAQLAGEVRVVRAIPRNVFRPVPHVDSVLVGVTRRGPAPVPALRRLVSGAFAHRRKTLARSLALVGLFDRDRVRVALEALGHPADVRAERLAPEDFRALGQALGVEAQP